jgi:hypothetical protein
MGRKMAWVGGIALAAVALVFIVRATHQQLCYACRRPVYGRSRAVGLVESQRAIFCCPACALSQHHQTGRRVRVTGLTDYLTEAPLSPERAYVVEGSDVNLCMNQNGMVDESNQPAMVHFDRCAPSLLAFSRDTDAAEFAHRHGGRLVAFKDLAGAYVR